MPKTLEGYVGDGAGLPLASIPATVKKVADGSAVASGATDAAGRWRFTGLPATDEYFVTLADGAGRAVVRGPWSGELREAWVRDRLDMPTTGVAVLPGGANAFLGTLAFDPPSGAGALDARYVNTSGDTMTGTLVVPSLTVGGNDLSQATLDARYVNTAGDAMSGTLTLPSLSVAGNDISYPSLDARYVNATGDAMTGALAVPSLTVAGVPINQTALDARYVNSDGDAMTGALVVNGLAVAASPDASNALEWRANGFYATAGGGGPSGTNTAAWVTRVATQTVPNATDTAVSFDTEVRDDGSYWASGSPTRITIPTTGWYGFAGWIIWEANTLGIRFLHLRKNATDFVASTSSGPHATDGNARLTVAMNLYLVAGDYVEMVVYHNRGASTTLTVAGALSVVGLGAAAAAGAPTTAPYITTAPDAGLSNEVLLASVIGYGTNAAMPAAAIAGRLYYDTTNSLLMRDSGTAWQSVEGAGGGGGLTKAQADTYYEPLDSAYTKAEADARYPQKTDLDPYPNYLTQTEGDARYTQGGITQAAADLRYEPIDTMYTKAESDARYVDIAGDTMTGTLNMTADILPTTTNSRDLGSTTLRWRKLWGVDADFTNAPTVGGAALLTATTADALFLTPAEGNAAYATAAHNHDATYVQLTGGSVMTGLLGPTTTNTRDLGTTTLRWRKLWAVDADLTNAPTVGGSALLTTAAGDAAYVNTVGDTMTGALTLTGAGAVVSTANKGSLFGAAAGPAHDTVQALADANILLYNNSATNWAGIGTEGTGAIWFKTGISGSPVPALAIQNDGVVRVQRASLVVGTAALPAWPAGYSVIHLGQAGSINSVTTGPSLGLRDNSYFDGTNSRAVVTGAAGSLALIGGTLTFYTAPSVAAGATQTFTARLTVANDGTFSVNSRPVIMAGCRVYHNALQTIASGTPTALAFNSERFDSDAFHDTVTNNNRLTVPAGMPGKYLIWANIQWNAVADSTMRQIWLRLNGTTIIGRIGGPGLNSGTFGTEQNVSVVYDLAGADYVEVVVQHLRGSNLDILTGSAFSPEFGMQRIG